MREDNNDVVPAKDVYEHLIEEGLTEKFPLTTELAFLDIESLNFPDDKATEMRRISRHLSRRRNMPLAFWNNCGGGFHCGFFLELSQSFDEVEEWMETFFDKENEEDKRAKVALKMILDMVQKMDCEQKYKFYRF